MSKQQSAILIPLLVRITKPGTSWYNWSVGQEFYVRPGFAGTDYILWSDYWGSPGQPWRRIAPGDCEIIKTRVTG